MIPLPACAINMPYHELHWGQNSHWGDWVAVATPSPLGTARAFRRIEIY